MKYLFVLLFLICLVGCMVKPVEISKVKFDGKVISLESSVPVKISFYSCQEDKAICKMVQKEENLSFYHSTNISDLVLPIKCIVRTETWNGEIKEFNLEVDKNGTLWQPTK